MVSFLQAQIRCHIPSSESQNHPQFDRKNGKGAQGNMSNHELNKNGSSMANAQQAQNARAFGGFLGLKIMSNVAGRNWPAHESQNILVNPASSLAQVALSTVASGPTFLYIFDESRYPIFARICELMPVDSIVALSQTCKSLSNLYKRIQPTQWNIDRRLKEYFNEPSRVRSLMGECGALISGRFAVEFFERIKFPQRSLEIYVEGINAKRFVTHLVKVEKYLRKAPIQRFRSPSEVAGFVHYERGSSTGAKQLKIGITRVGPVVAIINLERRSTICLNIISWSKAYALFPKSSFISHKGFLAHALDGKLEDNYSRYGWRVQDVQGPEDERRDKSFGVTRRVGDRHSWTIPFDTTKVSWSPTPDFVLEHAVFSIAKDKLNGTGQFDYYGYKISTGHRATAVLRYPYAIPSGRGAGGHASWMVFLNDRLNRLAPIEISKLAFTPARPTDFDRILNGEIPHWNINPTSFAKPDNWVYWDEEIPSWYEVWEHSRSMN